MGKAIDKMTPEELSETARIAGIASGKARREKREMRDILNLMLNMQMGSGKAVNLEAVKSVKDLKGKNLTVAEQGCLKMLEKFLHGDKAAAEWVRDTAGQKPTENATITMDLPIFSGEDELKQ